MVTGLVTWAQIGRRARNDCLIHCINKKCDLDGFCVYI